MSKDEKLPPGGAWQLVEVSERDVDPLTGLADAEIAELAEQSYEERNDPDAWEEVPAPEFASDVRSVVSVRFNPGELAAVEKAAQSAGMPLSTFIRHAAMTTASPVDVEKLRGAVEKLQRDFFSDIIAIAGTLGTARTAADLLVRLGRTLSAGK
jgi:predicted DNA binding CopG/RHH family protein